MSKDEVRSWIGSHSEGEMIVAREGAKAELELLLLLLFSPDRIRLRTGFIPFQARGS